MNNFEIETGGRCSLQTFTKFAFIAERWTGRLRWFYFAVKVVSYYLLTNLSDDKLLGTAEKLTKKIKIAL